ncbi:MAG TPA: carboxylating nicotinate-nucleotide diphosphorylase [Gammaproteobacteria bacterium]
MTTQEPAVPLPPDIAAVVARALEEDVGAGDVTAALIAPATRARASVVAKEDAVLCGTAWFDEVFRRLEPSITVRWRCRDGDDVRSGTTVCELEGPARQILTGERTALNFLQTLSGTATVARRYAQALAGTGCRVLDTRKTVPGLRRAQKYAVRVGGGTNHRMGLYDGVLIKENHIAAAGGVAAAVAAARRSTPAIPIEVEVENLDELREALDTDADRIMLDDFSLEDMRRAVELRNRHPQRRKELEASGSVSLDRLRAIAETGVDFVSVGALTKHVTAIDFSMRFHPPASPP